MFAGAARSGTRGLIYSSQWLRFAGLVAGTGGSIHHPAEQPHDGQNLAPAHESAFASRVAARRTRDGPDRAVPSAAGDCQHACQVGVLTPQSALDSSHASSRFWLELPQWLERRSAVPASTNRSERRHGDKAAEMELVDFRKYVEAAEKLINENPLGLKRVALVTSEDPLVIGEASRLMALDTGVPAAVSSRCMCATSAVAEPPLCDDEGPRSSHASLSPPACLLYELAASRVDCRRTNCMTKLLASVCALRADGCCTLETDTSPDTSWVVYTSIVQRMNDGPQNQLEHFGTR